MNVVNYVAKNYISILKVGSGKGQKVLHPTGTGSAILAAKMS
jgi:hypothetical protein